MTHSRKTLLRSRLAVVRRDLNQVVAHISPDMLDWAPSSGMRTVAGQILEIVGTEFQLIGLLKEGRLISDPEANEIIGDTTNLANLQRAMIDVRRATLEYLDTLSDADLAREVPFNGGWFGSLTLETIPRAEVFVNVSDHEWYHVGQLISYLWFRGDDPYKW